MTSESDASANQVIAYWRWLLVKARIGGNRARQRSLPHPAVRWRMKGADRASVPIWRESQHGGNVPPVPDIGLGIIVGRERTAARAHGGASMPVSLISPPGGSPAASPDPRCSGTKPRSTRTTMPSSLTSGVMTSKPGVPLVGGQHGRARHHAGTAGHFDLQEIDGASASKSWTRCSSVTGAAPSALSRSAMSASFHCEPLQLPDAKADQESQPGIAAMRTCQTLPFIRCRAGLPGPWSSIAGTSEHALDRAQQEQRQKDDQREWRSAHEPRKAANRRPRCRGSNRRRRMQTNSMTNQAAPSPASAKSKERPQALQFGARSDSPRTAGPGRSAGNCRQGRS